MSSSKAKTDYFESGKPIHQTSYCAFLDVLGFSQRLRDSYKANKANGLLQRFHAILKKRIAKLERDASDSMLYFKSFTDNVILAHPGFSDVNDMEAEFALILWPTLEYQFDMALSGFFIRGGLSVGQLFVDENSVYGEALLDAYELESKTAVNPIVVLSDKAMKLVDTHLTYYMGEPAPHLQRILRGADGRYFLNYLSQCLLETNDGYMLDTKSLKKHKHQIKKSLKEHAANPTIFSKFSWLASYHNYFCDSVDQLSGYAKNLKIPAKSYAVTFDLLK